MLTLGEFLAVISLTFTAFGLGYRLGLTREKILMRLRIYKNSRPGLGGPGG